MADLLLRLSVDILYVSPFVHLSMGRFVYATLQTAGIGALMHLNESECLDSSSELRSQWSAKHMKILNLGWTQISCPLFEPEWTKDFMDLESTQYLRDHYLNSALQNFNPWSPVAQIGLKRDWLLPAVLAQLSEWIMSLESIKGCYSHPRITGKKELFK